jgi:hypothetical protein
MQQTPPRADAVPPPRRKTNPVAVAFIGAVGILLILTAWTFSNPHANVPVISQVVCSAKGAAWYDGSAVWGIPPGCYATPAPLPGG